MKSLIILLLLFNNTSYSYDLSLNSNNPYFDFSVSKLTDLYGENGYNFTLNNVFDSLVLFGESANDFFGFPVSNAGDVNGDGYSDVVVSSYNYGFGIGKIYIYFGGLSMDNVADLSITGETVNTFGYSISTAGDVNGDGYDDIIVGAPDISFASQVRRAYIFYGGANMDNNADVVISVEEGVFSSSVSTAGDVNGDGFSDVIISSHTENNGLAYIFYGGIVMNNDVDVILNGGGMVHNFGKKVSSAGDVNGDGFDDIIASSSENPSDTNHSLIFYGGIQMDNIADVVLTGESINSAFGSSISSAGDLNRDGFSDVIISDYTYNNTIGRAYIYFGGLSMNSIADVILNGEGSNSYFGNSVSDAGDINGDGYSDVIIGCGNFNFRKGRAYIYFGGLVMNNIPDLVYNGEFINDDFGANVSKAGDVNGDNYSDVIIGAPNCNNGKGKAYVYSNLVSIPELVSPPNNSLNNPVSIDFKWRKFNSSRYYVLLISSNSTFNDLIVNDTLTVDTSKTISLFQKGLKYFWKVRAIDSSGNEKNSTVWNYSTILPIKINLKVIMEGMYYPIFNQMTRKDTMMVYLRNPFSPYEKVDSAIGKIDSISFSCVFNFSNTQNGTYYIVAKHNNCIETWSRNGGEVLVNNGLIFSYDLTNSISQAFGNNLKLKGAKYCIYSGNVNNDFIIDASDLSAVENDVYMGITGYVNTDLNGDFFVDAEDLSILENNVISGAIVISP